MKNYVLTIAGIILAMIANPGCVEKKPAVAESKLDPVALQYIQLTAGKYFIYKDSASGSLDSVVVTTSEKVKKFIPAGPGIISQDHYVEEFTLILTKMNLSVPQVWFFGKTYDNPSLPGWGSTTQPVDFRDPSNQTAFAYLTCFMCNVVLEILPSMTVEGRTFTNVVKVVTGNGIAPPGPGFKTMVYYWALGTGIIKIQKEDAIGKSAFMLLRNN